MHWPKSPCSILPPKASNKSKMDLRKTKALKTGLHRSIHTYKRCNFLLCSVPLHHLAALVSFTTCLVINHRFHPWHYIKPGMKVHTCNPRTPGRDKVILGYTASLGKERWKGGRKEGRQRGEGKEKKGRKQNNLYFIFKVESYI